jgi:hypothetical protein
MLGANARARNGNDVNAGARRGIVSCNALVGQPVRRRPRHGSRILRIVNALSSIAQRGAIRRSPSLNMTTPVRCNALVGRRVSREARSSGDRNLANCSQEDVMEIQFEKFPVHLASKTFERIVPQKGEVVMNATPMAGVILRMRSVHSFDRAQPRRTVHDVKHTGLSSVSERVCVYDLEIGASVSDAFSLEKSHQTPLCGLASGVDHKHTGAPCQDGRLWLPVTPRYRPTDGLKFDSLVGHAHRLARLPNVPAFSCERQRQQDRMLPRQQARGARRTHRTMLGANARARTGKTSVAGTTALVSCNALVGRHLRA